MATHKIEFIFDLPKLQNEVARMQFLLKRVQRDYDELRNLGIEITSDASVNDNLFKSGTEEKKNEQLLREQANNW